MKKYIVLREYRAGLATWNAVNDIDDDSLWVVTEEEIERLAVEWGKDKADLMAQVKEA